MPKISAVIIARNEENHIERCIKSLQGVADEILVVDTGSVDRTIGLAMSLGAEVLAIEWQGYARSKNIGNERASYDHILSLDADEALSPELREAILAEKPRLGGLYRFNRLTNYCGQWIRHCGWYPDPKLRLFDRRAARWEGEFVHESLQYDRSLEVKQLPGDLLHYSFESLNDHLRRVNHYSDLAAREIIEQGRHISAGKLWLSPPLKFFKSYILKQGWRDGFYGLCISAISAFDVFIRYAKVREGVIGMKDEG